MKSFNLDWKGWWLLRTPMSDVPELASTCGVYAVMGAKLKKVGNGVGSSGREPILFGVHRGDESIKENLVKLQKMSLGVFAANRAKEIRKHAIVYAAALPEDTDLGDLAAILSLIYKAVPFAPRHHAMPPDYTGEPMLIKNTGRPPGLVEEIFHGSGKPTKGKDSDATQDGEADRAMEAAIAAEAQATRRLTQEEMDARGIATEKVAKPQDHLATEKLDKPPRLVETAKVDKDNIEHGLATERVPKLVETTKVDKEKLEQGLATERVPKPADAEQASDTEFVPKPEESSEEPTILDEAGTEAN
ncbi:MAG: hypothetical protein K8I27_13550 [Planctomycetes bacterium]|nr:hypothetical protein [Planctomycetota bacterium]